MNPYIQYMYSYPHKTAYRALEGVMLGAYTSCLGGGGNSLYLHIPFCQTKCGYCNLFSVAGQGEDAVEAYLRAVERQSGQYREVLEPAQVSFSQVVIGGGTPLYLSKRQMSRMFDGFHKYFRLEGAGKTDLVIETAPNQTTGEKVRILKQAGATRVSMGIQSFSDRELAVLGRKHDGRRAAQALSLLMSADFRCVNVDLIYGIPGQTVESLLASVKQAVSFQPDEIFLYPLYVKHGVRMERQGVVMDGALAFTLYQAAAEVLREAGFRQDSMRRFVRGRDTRNWSECGFGNSLALGCGGRSYLGSLHFCSPYAITSRDCLAELSSYEQTTDYTEITHGFLLSEEEMRRRYVIRHLLIRPGLCLEAYKERFGSRATEDFPLLLQWKDRGFAEVQGAFFTLTQTGLDLSDYLGPQLISPQVGRAMREWEACHGQTHDFIQGQPEKL